MTPSEPAKKKLRIGGNKDQVVEKVQKRVQTTVAPVGFQIDFSSAADGDGSSMSQRNSRSHAAEAVPGSKGIKSSCWTPILAYL